MANPKTPDAGGRASGAHLVAFGAPDFSPMKVANGYFFEGAFK